MSYDDIYNRDGAQYDELPAEMTEPLYNPAYETFRDFERQDPYYTQPADPYADLFPVGEAITGVAAEMQRGSNASTATGGGPGGDAGYSGGGWQQALSKLMSNPRNIGMLASGLASLMNRPEPIKTYGGPKVAKKNMPQRVAKAAPARLYGQRAMGHQYFSAGGGVKPPQYLAGETDGMADQLRTTIDGDQPAALSHGEFVIPADVVAHLGNGNSGAGAANLRKMMAAVRKARTGNAKQGKQIDPAKFLAQANGKKVAKFSGGGDTSTVLQDANGTGTGTGIKNTSGTSTLADWSGDYVTDMLNTGWALGTEKPPVYEGALTAGQNGLQTKAFDTALNLQTPTGIGTAATTAGNVADKMGNLSYRPYGMVEEPVFRTMQADVYPGGDFTGPVAPGAAGQAEVSQWENYGAGAPTAPTYVADPNAQPFFTAPDKYTASSTTADKVSADPLDTLSMTAPKDVVGTNYTAQQGTASQAGPITKAGSQGYTADTFGGTTAGPIDKATSQGYDAKTFNAAKAGLASLATGKGYDAVSGIAAKMGPAATGVAAKAGPAALVNASRANAVTSDYDPTRGLQTFQMGPADKITTSKFTRQDAQDYMSPYIQEVLNIQQREAQRNADIASTQRASQAIKRGAFGGSRSAIMDAEAARNTAQQQNDIVAQGMQSAYTNAQGQFNTDQGRRLAADTANQGANLTVGQQNLAAKLGVQSLGTGARTQMELANLAARNQAGLQTSAQEQAAALANAGAQNRLSEFNTGNEQSMGLANLAATNRASEFNAGNEQAMGLANLAARNRASEFGAGAANTADLANALARNNTEQFNAGNEQAARAANAGAQNRASEFGAGAANTTNLANTAAANRLSEFNAGNLQQAGLAGSAARNAASAFGAGAANTADITNAAAANRLSEFNAGNEQAMGLANLSATNRASEFGAGQEQGAALANQATGLATSTQNLAAETARRQQEAAQALEAQRANQTAALDAARLNEQSKQFGAGQDMTAAQTAAQYGLSGAQLGESSRQFGANYGLQGLQGQLAAAQAQGNLSNMENQAGLANLAAQLSAGKDQYGIEAANVAAEKADFEQQRDAPYKQVQFMQSLLQGLPIGAYNTQSQANAPTDGSNTAGSIADLMAMYEQLFGKT